MSTIFIDFLVTALVYFLFLKKLLEILYLGNFLYPLWLEQGITNTLSLPSHYVSVALSAPLSLSVSLSLFLAIMAADVVCRSLSSPSVPVCWPAQRGTVGVVRCVVCGAAAVVRCTSSGSLLTLIISWGPRCMFPLTLCTCFSPGRNCKSFAECAFFQHFFFLVFFVCFPGDLWALSSVPSRLISVLNTWS